MRSRWLLGAAVLAVSLATAPNANAYSSGGPTAMSSCNACHHGGATPIVGFLVDGVAAASSHVKRGQTVKLAFTVFPPSAGQRSAGFRVTSPLPLSPIGADVQIVGAYNAQHTSPKNAGGAPNEFRFNVTIGAGEACGSVRTLTGWGSAVNGDGSTAGDGSSSRTLALTVDCPPSLVGAVAPALSGASGGPAAALPQLSEAEAARVLRAWLQTSNYYKIAPKYFALRNARQEGRDWVFDLVLQDCATSEPIDVWRVDSATREVARRTPGGAFVHP